MFIIKILLIIQILLYYIEISCVQLLGDNIISIENELNKNLCSTNSMKIIDIIQTSQVLTTNVAIFIDDEFNSVDSANDMLQIVINNKVFITQSLNQTNSNNSVSERKK